MPKQDQALNQSMPTNSYINPYPFQTHNNVFISKSRKRKHICKQRGRHTCSQMLNTPKWSPHTHTHKKSLHFTVHGWQTHTCAHNAHIEHPEIARRIVDRVERLEFAVPNVQCIAIGIVRVVHAGLRADGRGGGGFKNQDTAKQKCKVQTAWRSCQPPH